MADSDGARDAAGVEDILSEFEKKKDLFRSLGDKTKSLLEASLQDANIRYQSIQARVKTREKLRTKYANPEKGYRSLDDITDLVGLRVITYYEDEVDSVADVIKREFNIDPRSVDKRDAYSDRFGYHAINYVCCHSDSRIASVEYKHFTGLSCEIQVTSILRHAWAEIEHEWYDLRESYPAAIKRRFARMAALLEVAESEFLEIRNKRSLYERSISVQIHAGVSGVPVDPVSLAAFLESNEVVNRVDRRIAALRKLEVSALKNDRAIQSEARAVNRAGIRTVEQLRSLLIAYEEAIVECADLFSTCWPSPSTGQLALGVSIFHLAITLIGAIADSAQVLQALQEVIVQPQIDIGKVAEIVKRVAEKYKISVPE
jgi:putative GTP pyrophosphokinase